MQKPVLDLVHLARQSLGDKGRETEALAIFDAHLGQLLARLDALCARDPAAAANLARMLAASARTVGAAALAVACEAYARGGGEESELRTSLVREAQAVRDVISDLLAR